ncbi:hypothetical protein GGI01_003526 [Coemansia sp. RSA 376]|nr:hypothetical protein GGI14_001549 [Coemansia sp. S680]KAJ2059504.1 hypothetical protein GGI08_003226 [Coemansia sp. S2]KAJ2076040.1 hypothetical protein GGH13_000172 [Coemansia sp. S155-1]KAJ2259621.1 hypothetical protein GGI01_003526 [Coemansia sp. RSA 376]
MDVDLLGNDEQASDAPLDCVGGSSEHKLTESLDGLHLSDNSHEGFGDFIQQTSPWKPWTSPPAGSSHGKRQSPPVALSLEKTEYSTAQVLLPHIPFDFIPPPPMSATPPRTTHVPSPIASVPISRQNTVQKREIVKSQLEITTDQVLDWLSPIQHILKSDSVSVAINEAWENALGLMDGGGDQAGAHIAEVARRLCGVLDSFPVLSVGEPIVDVDISIDTDSLVESACETSAGGPDKMQRGRRENNIDLRVAELVWPEFTHSSDDTTGKDESSSDNLVSAYLRLAEMTR